MVKQPFRRTWRPGKTTAYIDHELYARDAVQYFRSFVVLSEDMRHMFEYIEPDDLNLKTYGFRIHGLLMRVSIEVEANLKAILQDNGFNRDKYNMRDFCLVEQSHRLSLYSFRVSHWKGQNGLFIPFKAWKNGKPLEWYQNYNAAKHDRRQNFHYANFETLMNAYCGLCALIWSQFREHDFSLHTRWSSGTDEFGYRPMTGDIVRIQPPGETDFLDHEVYSFSSEEWTNLKSTRKDPFLNFDYDSLRPSGSK